MVIKARLITKHPYQPRDELEIEEDSPLGNAIKTALTENPTKEKPLLIHTTDRSILMVVYVIENRIVIEVLGPIGIYEVDTKDIPEKIRKRFTSATL